MINRPMGAALAGLGLLLANGAVAPAAASAAALTSESPAAHSPAVPEPAYAISEMLAAASTDANAHVVRINGQVSRVSSEQVDAYKNLSTSLQIKLGAADANQVATRPRDTIMCPW